MKRALHMASMDDAYARLIFLFGYRMERFVFFRLMSEADSKIRFFIRTPQVVDFIKLFCLFFLLYFTAFSMITPLLPAFHRLLVSK